MIVSVLIIDLQDRKRAPLKHSRHCLENYTGVVLSMSEASDEEVECGSLEIVANPNISDQIMDGVHQSMIV